MSDKNNDPITKPIVKEETKNPFLDMELPPVSEQVVYHDDDKGEIIDSSDREPDNHNFDELDAEKANDYRGLKDDKGVAFDPSLHSAPPEKTPSGRWKKIPKREREKRTENGEQIECNASNRMEAQKAASIYASLHGIPFPTDCAPNPDNFKMLTDSIEQYYNENGAVEMSAGLNLLLSCGMYTQEVATRQTNLDKVKGWFKKCSAWAKNRRDKKVR